MRGSCRPSQGLTPYPLLPYRAMGWCRWHCAAAFCPRASRFLSKSESKRVCAT